ncbi:metal-dependent phosphohydrolase [Vibrio sp. SCSIO 43132]|uniref:HD domain-containing phosphohydrolase n=1 Tax=Vibrio sp. SCSIO 43132 TaxID=2779363 RepID=UPI001CA8F9AC|nr:HD domain-containing phosphohydrolase [Vibrio sp. SCSIO 43132]UAB72527.1 metal-dependent phosphohydrolase [Vibrio sp. SCSIO 43132]
MTKHRYPLSIHITSLFMALATVIGSVLIAISYHHSQQLLQGSAKELSNENSLKLETLFREQVAPVLTTLDFMAMSSFIRHQKDSVEKGGWLNSLEIIFQRNTSLVALYYGSDNGDFTLYRPLYNPKTAEQFKAPEGAEILFRSTDIDGRNESMFLDGDSTVLAASIRYDNQYDPRKRPWYAHATDDQKIHLTQPYHFYWLQDIGVTFVRKTANNDYVVAADFSLDGLNKSIGELAYASESQLLLFDSALRPLASHRLNGSPDSYDNIHLGEQLKNTVFSKLDLNRELSYQYYAIQHGGIDWSVTLTPVKLTDNVSLWLAEATPQDALLANLYSMRDKQVTVAILMLVGCFGIVWYIAKRIASPLHNLNRQTDNIRRFEFTKTRYPKSLIREVNDLTQSVELMEHTLHDLLELLHDTASNRDFSRLAKNITYQSYIVTKAETIVLSVWNKNTKQFDESVNQAIIPLKININLLLKNASYVEESLKKGEIVHLSKEDEALKPYLVYFYNSDLYLFPLLNRDQQLIGILTLGYERPVTAAQKEKHDFLRELLSFAAIAKENIDQIQQQKDMLNAFIELLASAIDTKSPYTGKHCQRVPALAEMLTQAVVDDKGRFEDFQMTEKEWEELHLGAWLHDCGKIITPEYVVDKATKLETIYDRIHEVRMRFELLKQTAHTQYWKGLSSGKDQKELKQALDAELKSLDEDFRFIADCNLGSEFMDDSKLERIEEISKRQWTRTIDDQLGISWVEKSRCEDPAPLPVMESVLSDKQVHRIPWAEGFNPKQMWKEDFNLTPGDYHYNRGELYNLSVRSGTLTNEERFIINDHIIQTIDMLDKLPYPEYLQKAPEIAGCHHERVDGTGYPRGYMAGELCVPARVMAIADIFEALTASDRPYKKAKNLKESLSIMTKLATTGHLDPELYLLFLQQGVYMKYAREYLSTEQMVEVDVKSHMTEVLIHLSKLASEAKRAQLEAEATKKTTKGSTTTS